MFKKNEFSIPTNKNFSFRIDTGHIIDLDLGITHPKNGTHSQHKSVCV